MVVVVVLLLPLAGLLWYLLFPSVNALVFLELGI